MARSAHGPETSINVTPMVDVMLVLLIIFMIVTPVITSRLPTGAHTLANPEEPDEITLAIDRDRRYYLSATGRGAPEELQKPRLVTPDSLPGRLGALYAGRTRDRTLFLRADRDLEFARIEGVLAVARTAGVRTVAAVTEQRRPRKEED